MVKTNFCRLTFDAKEVNGMPLEYISNDNPKKNLYDTLRKFQLNTLLCVISKETATFFAEENSGLNFGIKYETYQLREKMTKKCVDVNTYVTGWTLLDLSYNAICCTHDYRGTGEITPQTVWFLSQLSGEYLGSLESAAIDNFEDTDMDMILYLWRANKMRKTKVACFSYKKHDDIYVSNISFSTNVLLSILDVFLDQKIIVLIESDEDKVQTLSKIGKSLEMTVAVALIPVPRFSAACDKMKLSCLFNQIDVNDFEGMFIVSIDDRVIADELVCSIANTANSMVKCGTSDISISINFPENQMIISFAKGKYEVQSIKEKIYSIFAD